MKADSLISAPSTTISGQKFSFSLCWHVSILKRCLTFEPSSFKGKKNINSSKYKRKRKIFPFLIFLFSFIFFFSFFNPKHKILFKHQIMGVKHGFRSSFDKFAEPSPSKSSKPLLGGDENPSIEEQWIIPPFFEDYLFNKSLDWDLVPCSEHSPYTACEEPNDLLTMDLELKHIPRLGTCRGDFAPTVDVVFKSHTSVSRG